MKTAIALIAGLALGANIAMLIYAEGRKGIAGTIFVTDVAVFIALLAIWIVSSVVRGRRPVS